MVIDGEKFVVKIGLSGRGFTSADVFERLKELGEDEVEAILKECCISLDEVTRPTLSLESLDMLGSEEYKPVGYDNRLFRSESELRKLIKYERNPMRKKQLQAELSTMNSWNGKHRKGRS